MGQLRNQLVKFKQKQAQGQYTNTSEEKMSQQRNNAFI